MEMEDSGWRREKGGERKRGKKGQMGKREWRMEKGDGWREEGRKKNKWGEEKRMGREREEVFSIYSFHAVRPINLLQTKI